MTSRPTRITGGWGWGLSPLLIVVRGTITAALLGLFHPVNGAVAYIN